MSQLKLILLPQLLLLSALCLSCGPGGESQRAATATGVGEAQAPTVDVVKVVSQKLDITVRLPGELQPYEVVAIYPKVTGFVKWIGVDRGSHVSKGELIARLEAPELVSQRAEAQAKLQTAEAQRIEAEAKLAADESTYQRLKAAATTPGVVSGNELEVAKKTAEADRARAGALGQSVEAAKAALRSVEEVERYLRLAAPFAGVVTERNVHPGALVGPGVAVPMLRIETRVRLRLVVPVPETFVAGIPEGTKVSFTVPAFPGETFSGRVARIAHSVDVKTRTMPVELDVMNPSGRLDPGMFPEVLWPVRRPWPTLFVPASAVARTTERVFVVRVRDGKSEWVDVKTGATSGSLIEVFGDLKEGDQVALRGTDEVRPRTGVTPRLVPAS
jgi:RND family efflux transporter MFP subunit